MVMVAKAENLERFARAYVPATWAAWAVAGEGTRATWPTANDHGEPWRICHERLRSTARRRAELDAEEAELLREAEQLQIWKPLGMVSLVDYMERVLGWNPETARKRLRTARALGELPVLSAALRDGVLSFSAIRELTRVATPATEGAWRDDAIGKNLRDIEDRVRGHVRGDLPDDPPDPDVSTRIVRFELSPATYARLRQARLQLDEEHGRHLDDDELIAALASAVLETTPAQAAPSPSGPPVHRVPVERGGRATFQIATVVCERCDQGWIEGAGVRVAIDPATLDRARCDAQHVGSVEGDGPARAAQVIPPAVDRFVRLRDGGRCQTPGCRSARALELHHIVHRSDGGSHDPSNLTLRCFSCHQAHHEGRLTIRGTAPDRVVTERREQHALAVPRPVAEPSRADARTEARDALVTLGFKPSIAKAAIDEAAGHVAHDATIEAWICAALRRCPRPCT